MCPQEIATEVSITYLVVAGKRLRLLMCANEKVWRATHHCWSPNPFCNWQPHWSHGDKRATPIMNSLKHELPLPLLRHKGAAPNINLRKGQKLSSRLYPSPQTDMLTGWLLRSLSLAFWTPKSRSPPPPMPQARSILGGSILGGTWSPAWQQLKVDPWHFWVGAAGLWSHKGYLGGPQAVTMATISQYTQLLHVETFSIA